MFIKNCSEDDFFKSLESNLNKESNRDKIRRDNLLKKAKAYLEKAAEHCEHAGCDDDAVLIRVVHKLRPDDSTKGLTPKKMLENLATKGWMFNADDGLGGSKADLVLAVALMKDQGKKDEEITKLLTDNGLNAEMQAFVLSLADVISEKCPDAMAPVAVGPRPKPETSYTPEKEEQLQVAEEILEFESIMEPEAKTLPLPPGAEEEAPPTLRSPEAKQAARAINNLFRNSISQLCED